MMNLKSSFANISPDPAPTITALVGPAGVTGQTGSLGDPGVCGTLTVVAGAELSCTSITIADMFNQPPQINMIVKSDSGIERTLWDYDTELDMYQINADEVHVDKFLEVGSPDGSQFGVSTGLEKLVVHGKAKMHSLQLGDINSIWSTTTLEVYGHSVLGDVTMSDLVTADLSVNNYATFNGTQVTFNSQQVTFNHETSFNGNTRMNGHTYFEYGIHLGCNTEVMIGGQAITGALISLAGYDAGNQNVIEQLRDAISCHEMHSSELQDDLYRKQIQIDGLDKCMVRMITQIEKLEKRLL